MTNPINVSKDPIHTPYTYPPPNTNGPLGMGSGIERLRNSINIKYPRNPRPSKYSRTTLGEAKLFHCGKRMARNTISRSNIEPIICPIRRCLVFMLMKKGLFV